MPMKDFSTITEREAARSDMSAYITHLTRGEDSEKAYEKLWKDLQNKKLIVSV